MRPGEVVVSTPDGEQCIRAATVIWTARVRASHLGHASEATTGCSLDHGGLVVVESDFSIASYPEIRIAGDLCSYSHTKDGQPVAGGQLDWQGHCSSGGRWSSTPKISIFRSREHGHCRWV